MRIKAVFAALLMISCLTSCTPLSSGTEKKVSRTVFAMDTVMDLTAYGEGAEDAILQAEEEITRLDRLFRRDDPKSDIYVVNTKKEALVSPDTASVISSALSVSEETGGAFDITVTPLIDLWGFYTKDFHIPTEKELENARANVDYRKITVSGDTVTAGENTTLDLGGIAKGYLSDRIMQIFHENGVSSGIVSLGGNVQTIGHKPDGSDFLIAVQAPDDPEDFIGTLSVCGRAVITSGAYQRNFTEGGILYHHILDPKTGKPAESGLKSVTVVSKSGTSADALSTALFVMGLENGAFYWQRHDSFEVIFVTDANRIFISQGLQSVFESPYPFEVITR